jgi:hypothetical protein
MWMCPIGVEVWVAVIPFFEFMILGYIHGIGQRLVHTFPLLIYQGHLLRIEFLYDFKDFTETY